MSHDRADDAIIAGFYSALAACAVLDCVRDPSGRITDFTFVALNPSAEHLIERRTTDLVGRSVRDAPPFAGLHDSAAEYGAVFETGTPLVDEFRVTRARDARKTWVHRLVTRLPTGVMVVLRDIADDANLRRTGDAFFQMADDLWCTITPDGTFVRVNSAFERILGWTEDQLLGVHSQSLVHPDDMSAVLARQRLPAGTPQPALELRMRRTDGSYRRISWSGAGVPGDTHRYAVGHDVTEQRRAEDESRKFDALLQAVLEGTPDVIFVKDAQGRYLLMNAAGAAVHGRRVDEVIGRDDTEIAPNDAVRRRESDLRVMTLNRGETYEVEPKVGASGRRFWVITMPYRDSAGTVIGVIGVARDITDQRRLETQVNQAQRMEAVGRLAGGIAHDFNNVLTAILSLATLAGETLPADHPAKADLAAIRRASEGAAVLTRQMLVFSRRQRIEPRAMVLNDVVCSTELLLRSLVGDTVNIVTTLDPELAIIQADPSQIEQVLVNLVVNAGHAMPDGGTIWVETTNARVTQDDAVRLPKLPVGPYVCLTVRDTGVGMDEATRLRIFEPFFTTKPEEKGTGLGLSCVYGIVRQSHGGIFVESQPGRGSEFAVYLPAVPDVTTEPFAPPATPARAATPRGDETVLLVEDNAIVRRSTEQILSNAGYRLYVASNGVEALGVVASLRGAIDLLITDLSMPEMGGRAMLARLREDWPNLRALLVSGYEPGEATDPVALPPGTLFLQKPFTAETLLRAVRTMLDSTRATRHP